MDEMDFLEDKKVLLVRLVDRKMRVMAQWDHTESIHCVDLGLLLSNQNSIKVAVRYVFFSCSWHSVQYRIEMFAGDIFAIVDPRSGWDRGIYDGCERPKNYAF